MDALWAVVTGLCVGMLAKALVGGLKGPAPVVFAVRMVVCIAGMVAIWWIGHRYEWFAPDEFQLAKAVVVGGAIAFALVSLSTRPRAS